MVITVTDDLLRCDWLGRIGLILTRAVHHLAAYPFGNDRWLHRPRWVGWQVRYLDIYLVYVYGPEEGANYTVIGAMYRCAQVRGLFAGDGVQLPRQLEQVHRSPQRTVSALRRGRRRTRVESGKNGITGDNVSPRGGRRDDIPPPMAVKRWHKQRRNSHPGSPGAPGGPPRAGGPARGKEKKFCLLFV